MSRPTQSRAWIKDRLAEQGYSQRDLARAWGVSEAGVTRFCQGLENADPALSRVVILAQMLGMTLDEVAKSLGFRGAAEPPPPSLTKGTEGPRLGTVAMTPHDGRLRLLLHLDLPASVAAEMVSLLEKASPLPVSAPG
jgi:transcriptional regulator with XRE-family HTH domain